MKEKLVRIAVPLLIVSVAASAVYLWAGKNNRTSQALAETARESDHVWKQNLNADYSTAKRAMINHIRRLDQLSDESNRPGRNPYAVDAMIWYARLSKLEERNGGREKAAYMREAVERCKKLRWADCSEENLRGTVGRIDTAASR